MSKNDLRLLGPGCNSDLSTCVQTNIQIPIPERWERVSSAMEKEQKFPILLLIFLKRKTSKNVLALRGKFIPSLKFLAGAVIGMTRGTSLSMSPPY